MMISIEKKLKQLGGMIERARRARRLSTRQMADFAGISSSELNSVESGENWPSEHVWERLCETLGLPINMMEDMKKDRQPVAAPPPASAKGNLEIVKASNVIELAAHKKKKWQQTSLFERD